MTHSHNKMLFEVIRQQDPELAEDLNRRMTLPLCNTFHLSNFINDILYQYPKGIVKPWFIIDKSTELSLETWFQMLRVRVLPFFIHHRLPSAGPNARPIYPL